VAQEQLIPSRVVERGQQAAQHADGGLEDLRQASEKADDDSEM
jgi:hypothetical protein